MEVKVDISELTLGEVEEITEGEIPLKRQLEILDHIMVEPKTAREIKIKDLPRVMEVIQQALEEQSNPLVVPVVSKPSASAMS